MEKPIELVTNIELTNKELAAALKVPEENKRQRDLQYFTAILVSSGANLNHAFFLPSELIKAKDTIVNKAVDVEHDEQRVVGHMYDRAFMWKDRRVFDPISLDPEGIDELEMDIAVAGIIYRERFPDLAREVEEGKKWKLSMECYYEDYDVKIGNIMIPSKEALSLGYNNMIGKLAVAKFNNEVVVADVVVRVLRNIIFSGSGLVENPANPPSVILEVASVEERIKKAEESNMVISLNNVESWMRAKQEKESISITTNDKERAMDNVYVEHPDNIASPSQLCVYYKRHIFDNSNIEKTGQDRVLVHENWCSAYDKECGVVGDALNPNCFRFIDMVKDAAILEVTKAMACKDCSKLYEELGKLMDSLDIAKKYLNEGSAVWTTKYVNSLPNSAFICIEKGYKDGESPKSARHLPYRDLEGKVDLPHLRNALARCNQIKSVLGNESDEALRKRACTKAQALAKQYLKSKK